MTWWLFIIYFFIIVFTDYSKLIIEPTFRHTVVY